MKTHTLLFLRNCTAAALLIAGGLQAQIGPGFLSGSTGADGALVVSSSRVLPLPPDGIFNFTTIQVNRGATLSFTRNEANTPVYLLATGDVLVEGAITVSGQPGTALAGGAGGPGGFDGGRPGIVEAPPGAGQGPGGGKGGPFLDAVDGVGSGSYSTVGLSGRSANKGAVYGSQSLMPMLGGSGGGGIPGTGGAGGGGAILIASSTRIEVRVPGVIQANGGQSSLYSGSGGAIRLIAPTVAGAGQLSAQGIFAGDGRIRVDAINWQDLALQYFPNTTASRTVGKFMVVFPPQAPELNIIEVAERQIPAGSTAPVQIQLPFGSAGTKNVIVQARNFNRLLPITVALIPDSGPPAYYQATLDNTVANPATKTVPVSFPENVPVRVQAWTR